MSLKIKIPPLFSINENIKGNLIQQIVIPACSLEATVANYTSPKIKGKLLIPTNSDGEKILLVGKKDQSTSSFSKIILVNQKQIDEFVESPDLSTNVWLKHPDSDEVNNTYKSLTPNIIKSWENCFSYVKGSLEKDIKGLREPQIGAVHAIHAYWSVTDKTGTIVMPTGTGKTETMISVLVSIPCSKVVIIVPTDALRTQIAEKFLTLGVLKDCGAVSIPALYPVVGILNHKPQTIEEVDNFFEKCNVIVTTSHIAGQAPRNIQRRMAYHCSELFIDEAHHVQAPTWKKLKTEFQSCRTLQFTATPFRDDDKPLEGNIVYKYPLQKAQEEGYFKKINFKPVRVFSRKKHDSAIAEMAVEQLREDLKKYNHILMARVNNIPRAREVFSVYEKYKEFNPVQIHTDLSNKEINEAKQKIRSGESKIVICVEMLGEGFDLPELKIAAFHDIRKSLPITIQLAGRFTRQRPDLGDATFIANIGRADVRSKLKRLYQQDTDWNFLLRHLTEEQIQDHIDLNEYKKGFRNFPKEIPIESLNPALSTVVYKTKCAEWTPDNFSKGILGLESSDKHFYDVYPEKNTLIIVTQTKQPVEWTQVQEVFNWDWNLYVVFWDKEQNLLFINNSSNKGEFKRLAQAVAGNNVELVKGDALFRCFSNITRLTFKNIGLSEEVRKLLSYTGNMGSNVGAVLTEIQTRRARKSVMFGTGFEEGEKTSIGCSKKGRIWHTEGVFA
jgi:superfamily II DNA or RNA helicase